MFAILAINIVGDQLGYCSLEDTTLSNYGIGKAQVNFLKIRF